MNDWFIGETRESEVLPSRFTIEALARMARQAGDWDLAGHLARHMEEHDANYGGTHYALGLVAEHQGDATTARVAFGRAVKNWSSADASLPELADARRRLGASR